MEYVILGLGSNVGDRQGMLAAAVEALGRVLRDKRVSSLYETPALLPPGAPVEWDAAYINQAVAGWTALSPQALLREAKCIEEALGRVPRGHWGPREIDIDILAYGEQVVESPELKIPHAGLLERAFALKPLAEIAPRWVYPCAPHPGKTAAQLVEELFP